MWPTQQGLTFVLPSQVLSLSSLLEAYPNPRGVGTGFQRTGLQRTGFQKTGFLVFLFGFKSPEGYLKPNIFCGGGSRPPPHTPPHFLSASGLPDKSWKIDFPLISHGFPMDFRGGRGSGRQTMWGGVGGCGGGGSPPHEFSRPGSLGPRIL